MKRVAVGIALLLLAGVSMAAKIEYVIHVHKLGIMDVAIECDNGQQPKTEAMHGYLVVSCGEQAKHAAHELKGHAD